MANIARSGPLTQGLYKELWRACAGPLAYVPHEGERVYYFPQGHVEQFAPSVDGLDQQLSILCLPAKIVCKVLNVQLLADPDTDELYANIILLPEHDQNEVRIADPERLSRTLHSFCKTLTESDTTTHEGFCFLQSQAPLNMSQYSPCKQLVTYDLHGNEWPFSYVFQEKTGHHMLTEGWSAFLRAKKCVTGDGFVLLRDRKGEMFVGVRRRLTLSNKFLSTSVTLSRDQLAFLSVASHALTTGTRFSVIYKPRCCRSLFIVSINRYLEAQNRIIFVGMRFRMTYEDEKSAERRFAGTVVAVRDSEWKPIQVEWDEVSPRIILPDNVSSWEIEGCKSSVWTSCFKKIKNLFCGACRLF